VVPGVEPVVALVEDFLLLPHAAATSVTAASSAAA
jgi:hypothetical protein